VVVWGAGLCVCGRVFPCVFLSARLGVERAAFFFGNSQTSAQQFFVMWWADFVRIFSNDWRHVRL